MRAAEGAPRPPILEMVLVVTGIILVVIRVIVYVKEYI